MISDTPERKSKRVKESSNVQPGQEAVVWEHNRLAEARYELSAREQKLLLYVIAMIEPEDADFKRYVVNIPEFAQLAGLQKDDLYRELRELAKGLKQKPLIVPHHFDEQTGTYLDVVTNWFDTAYVGRNGAGYFAVTLSPVLKPYLLQVKREFFRFRLYQVMQLKSGYAIRLYQWAKRWEFRKVAEISLSELRIVLGVDAPGILGAGDQAKLSAYGHLKDRAIKPAVQEINRKTDLKVSFRELKQKGSKAVERLLFRIERKQTVGQLEVLEPPAPAQLEFGLEADDDQLLDESVERYALNEVQRTKIHEYLVQRGAQYIREKMFVVDQEPRENAAKAFLAALRDDWKPKIQTLKPPSPAKKKAVPPQPEEPPVSDEERAQTSAQLKEFIQTLRTSH
jgi:plasmid replication initiation protein